MKTTKKHLKYSTREKQTHVTSEVVEVVSILTSATGIPRRATSEAKAAAG
jgi:hypothetical protein